MIVPMVSNAENEMIEWERVHDQVWNVTRREMVEAGESTGHNRVDIIGYAHTVVQVKPGSGEKRLLKSCRIA